MGWRAGIRFLAGDIDFSLFHRVQTGSETHPICYSMGTGALSLAVKRQRREADHSPPPSAEVKNGGAILPLPHSFSWRSAWLIKRRDNFTFTFSLLKHRAYSTFWHDRVLPRVMVCSLNSRELCTLLSRSRSVGSQRIKQTCTLVQIWRCLCSQPTAAAN
jgi:hypothetical protein